MRPPSSLADWSRLLGDLRRRVIEQPVEAIIDGTPVDLRIVGRTLLHAMVVGLAAGLLGVGFVRALDGLQYLLLESLAGYVPLRTSGEETNAAADGFRWWLMVPLLFAGGAVTGLVTRYAPETRGGSRVHRYR